MADADKVKKGKKGNGEDDSSEEEKTEQGVPKESMDAGATEEAAAVEATGEVAEPAGGETPADDEPKASEVIPEAIPDAAEPAKESMAAPVDGEEAEQPAEDKAAEVPAEDVPPAEDAEPVEDAQPAADAEPVPVEPEAEAAPPADEPEADEPAPVPDEIPAQVNTATWCYRTMDEWPNTLAGYTNLGKRQSPIDLPKAGATPKRFDNFTIAGNKKTTWDLHNNGNTLKVTIADPADNNVIVQGGPTTCEYRFDHFHFHWGNATGQGAEHTMDGFSFDGEIHYVFRCQKEGDPDNEPLLVFGLFMQLPKYGKKSSMSTILERIDELVEYNSKVKVENIDFFRILKSCFVESDFFTYFGSLTTPPFDETVRHVVFEKPGEFGEGFFKAFRAFKDAEGNINEKTHRVAQDMADREVIRGTHIKKRDRKRKPDQ